MLAPHVESIFSDDPYEGTKTRLNSLKRLQPLGEPTLSVTFVSVNPRTALRTNFIATRTYALELHDQPFPLHRSSSIHPARVQTFDAVEVLHQRLLQVVELYFATIFTSVCR